jgi:hypothetical protein
MTRIRPGKPADRPVEVPTGRQAVADHDAGEELTGTPALPIPTLTTTARRAEPRYTLTPIDRDGRLADRSALGYLGWVAGWPVAWNVDCGPIAIAQSGAGAHVDRRGHLRLPLPLRRICRIASGDRVLLAADCEADELLVIPSWVLHRMIRAGRGEPGGVAGDE